MNFDKLNKDNIMLYAIKHYDNPQCVDMEEFKQDFNRLVSLKKLFGRYQKTGELRTRLILNHIIILYNVFGVEAATRILFYAIEPSHFPFLKPFLISQGYIDPNKDYSVWGVQLRSIPLDLHTVNCIRELLK